MKKMTKQQIAESVHNVLFAMVPCTPLHTPFNMLGKEHPKHLTYIAWVNEALVNTFCNPRILHNILLNIYTNTSDITLFTDYDSLNEQSKFDYVCLSNLLKFFVDNVEIQ
jgi:hypothetical protein